MPKTVIVQYPTDNVAPLATWTVETGVEDADYPAPYVADANVARPAKLTSTTGAWLATFPGAQRVDVAALGPHNFPAGATVKIQANTTNSWGTPAFEASFTIPATEPDGRRTTVWLDLTAQAGYSATGWAYWRLLVNTAISAGPALGEIWLGQAKRVLGRNYSWGWVELDRRRLVENETEYGVVMTYDLQVRQRIFSGTVRASDADLTTLRTWHRAMRGRVYVGLFVPDASVNEAWWVRGARDFSVTKVFADVNDVQLELEEVSLGLPLS